MRTSILATSALFASNSVAQYLFDPTLVDKVVLEVNAFVASVIKNPAIITAVSSLEALGVPAATIARAEADPVFLLENLVADYTDVPLINSIPTALGNTLRSVLAVPLKAIEEVASFITELEAEPDFQFALSQLTKYVPLEVQQEFSASPIPFLENLVEQNTVPAYFSAVPTAVIKEIAHVFNQGLGIVASDFQATSNATITKAPTFFSTGTVPYPTTGPKYTVTGVASTGSGVHPTRTAVKTEFSHSTKHHPTGTGSHGTGTGTHPTGSGVSSSIASHTVSLPPCAPYPTHSPLIEIYDHPNGLRPSKTHTKRPFIRHLRG